MNYISNKHSAILNEVRNGIADLILDNKVDIKVKHEVFNEYVDFECGIGIGLRQALGVVYEVMRKYGIKIKY